MSNFRSRTFKYEIWIVALLLFMPLLLMAFDGGNIRPSISDYVYMEHNQVFYFLLFLAASMFGNNGALWVKNYNILLGMALAGIALTPYLQFPVIHYAFATMFFVGSVFVMVFYSSSKQRKYKIYAGILIIVVIAGSIFGDLYSLLIAEWLGIVPISIHFLGESKGVVD